MANVLGELFSEIATSIRGGLGDIGAMKPNAFPDRIDDIVELLKNAGSGGGSGEGGNGDSDSPSISNRFQLKCFNITTDAQGIKVVINHGMGKMPDMVFVFYADYDKDGAAGEIANGSYMLATYAMKREFNPDGVCQFYITRWISVSTGTFGEDKPTTDITSEGSTAVFCPNDTQICFGSGNLAPNSNFKVIALSGVGGGSSADIRYVTFMNDDGTEVLGKKAVAVGDDCADPIARGIFETPTKESTPQYSYTFSGGWATTPGGGENSNALKAVTEDRTVYANFISTLRSYTITFYDDDGVTVLNTKTYTYGSTPSYTPVNKDGYLFGGWVPALTTVTGDASYTANWVESVDFAAASWETIAARAADGTASQFWKLGDKKTITYKGKDLRLVIAGFNHDDLADGSGKAGITIVYDSLPDDAYTWSNSKSYIYSYVNNNYIMSNLATILAYFPADLRSVIKPVTKQVCDTATSGNGTTTIDQSLWMLSLTELGYTKGVVLGSRYSYFPSFSSSSDADNCVCENQQGPYWTRSHERPGEIQVNVITMYGVVTKSTGTALYSTGTPRQYRLGFCI